MAVAIILLLVAVGSVLFHLFSPWWWTPIATNWRYIDDTITITFWITGAVFFAVIAFMAYCVFRFHHKEGRQAAYNPENKKLEWWLTIVTAVGVGAMLAPGLVVWHQFVTVPAGTFQALVVQSKLEQPGFKFGSGVRTSWFAPGKGLVKLVFRHGDRSVSTVELLKK